MSVGECGVVGVGVGVVAYLQRPWSSLLYWKRRS